MKRKEINNYIIKCDFITSFPISKNDYIKYESNFNYPNIENVIFFDSVNNISKELINNKDRKNVFVKSNILLKKQKKLILTIKNNKRKVLIWINKQFFGSCNDWFSRKLIYLKKGNNELLLLIENYSFKEKVDLEILVPKKTFFKDQLYDIKNRQLIIKQENNSFDVTYISDNYKSKKLQKVIVAIPYINYINKSISYKIIDIFKITKNITKTILYNDYSQKTILGWIFLCFTNKKQRNIEKLYRVRVFVKKIEDCFDLLYNNIITYSKKENIDIDDINSTYNSCKNREDINISIKYYILFSKTLSFFKTISNRPDKNNITKNFYLSNYGNNKIEYNLSEPINKKKKYTLLLILSKDCCNAYIDFFKTNFGKKYLIIELNLLGKQFGYFSDEYFVIEFLNKIKKEYEINKIVLFAYSMCATAVANLCGKYPFDLSGGLCIGANLIDPIIYNCNYLLCIDNYQEDSNNNKYKHLYDSNIELLNIKGYSHETINVFVRNKKVINYVIKKSKITNKKSFYYSVSEKYPRLKEVKVINRVNEKIGFKIYVKEINKVINIITENVKILFLFNGFTYIINKIKMVINNNCFYNVITGEIINENKNFLTLNNGLGILNIYCNQVKCLIEKEDDYCIIKEFLTPKNFIYNSQFLKINYEIKKNINYYDEETNLIFYNNRDYNSMFLFDKDGFTYKNKKYIGEYSIIEIILKSISKEIYYLYINDNDSNASKKNLFIRKVIIPSNPLIGKSIYNNNAIIFFNNKYYYIYYYDEDIKEF